MSKFINKSSLRLMPFFSLQYMVLCVYQNFFTVYLNDIGVNSKTIGVLMAIAPLVSLMGQPVWGNVGDKIKLKNILLSVLCVVAAVMMLAISISSNVIYIAVCLGVFAFFYLSIQPIGDTIALESLDKENLPFGPVRAIGTVSFAVLSAVSGLFLTGHSERVPWVTALLLFLTFACVFVMPKVEGHRSKQDTGGIRELLKYKPMMIVFGFSACLMIGMVFFYNFFSIYYIEDLDGSQNMLGVCYFISAMSEIPFLMNSDKLYKRFGVMKILSFSGSIMALRWLILFLVQSPWVAMVSQVLHCSCILMMTFTVTKYVNDVVPPKYKAAGQLMYTLFTLSAARIIGALLGGQIAEYFGRRNLFLIGAAFTIVCIIIFSVYYSKHRDSFKIKKENS